MEATFFMAFVAIAGATYFFYVAFFEKDAKTKEKRPSLNRVIKIDPAQEEKEINKYQGQANAYRQELEKLKIDYQAIKKIADGAQEKEAKLEEELAKREEWLKKADEIAKNANEKSIGFQNELHKKEQEASHEFTKNVQLAQELNNVRIE
ncbi:MAG: hypothetical protein FJZ11_05480, partial [Candidatus Omnitrophica bacterium]|nr:hypothetical protein [Candidatus Omnitrophota bacterium]